MSVDGTWNVSIDLSGGVREARLTIQTEGETLSGVIADQSGPTEVHGKVEGDDVEFVATAPAVSGPMVMTFFGRVEGDRVSGGTEFGEAGSGTWTGTRA
jgi:hypothetical protein